MPARIPVNIGSAARLTPAAGATMNKNAFGIDVLQRPFTCPRSLVQSSVPGKGVADIFYGNLKATGNFSITENEGLQCLLTVEYKGLLTGALPDPLISSSLSTGSVSATSGDDEDDKSKQRTWDVVFSSPSSIFRYVTSGRPIGPRFNSYAGGPVNGPGIILQSIKDGTGRPRASAPGISLIAKAQLSGFNANPVAGTPYYECEETWTGIFEMR